MVKNEKTIFEAAKGTFRVVLRNHLHGRDLYDCHSAAGKWVKNIIHQMQADGFDSKDDRVEEVPKPKRGRPKKQDLKPDADPEVERKVQTRSQGNRTGAVAGIHSLFQTPCLTKSPTKIRKKVGVPHYNINFGS